MYQRIEIIGDLGKEPEMRYTPSGQPVTNFSVATTNTYSKDGDKIKETTWFRISVWGNMAESCKKYLSKGSRVMVEGRLTVDKETGGPKLYRNQEGVVSSSFEITAQNVKFLDKLNGSVKKVEKEEPEYEEDLPGFMQDED